MYDPAKDDPTGKNTPFEKLPASWTCPVCGAAKSEYGPQLTESGETVWVHEHPGQQVPPP
eukprot:COSAG02_NODE_2426_length_8891_cov_4.565059_4_plen_60_part_00